MRRDLDFIITWEDTQLCQEAFCSCSLRISIQKTNINKLGVLKSPIETIFPSHGITLVIPAGLAEFQRQRNV